LSTQSVSRRYAVALADVLGEKGEEQAVKEELSAWGKMVMSSSDLQGLLANPTVPYEQKKRVLNELIKRTGVSQTTANFLQVLLRNQRLLALPQINAKLGEVLDDRAGAVAAHVTTAKPINEETKRLLADKLSRHTGKAVRLDFSTDDSLIGGIVTRVGSTIYDGSIKTQLKEMEKVLSGQQ
jgi:F-type H+-transporting ATPase subunit delta